MSMGHQLIETRDSRPTEESSRAGLAGIQSLKTALLEILSDSWHYRELLYQLTLRDIRIRYKQAVMGFAWALFIPVLVVLAGLVVRNVIAYLTGSHLEAKAVLAMSLKAMPWSFFVGAIGFATGSLTSNIALITKVYFPREVMPLSATVAQGFDSLIGGAGLLPVLFLLGLRWSTSWLWVPVLALLLVSFTAAAALFLSCANLFFRDVKYIVQVLLMFGIFFTPVFFEPAMLGPVGARIAMLNPLSPLLEGLRLSITEGHNLVVPLVTLSRGGGDVLVWTPWYLVYAALWSVGGLLGAGLLFHHLEFVFAEYI